MENYIKIIVIVLIALVALTIITSNFDINDINRSYSIDQATIDLFIENETELHIKESLLYSFHGTYNGVYRDIPLKSGEYLENINVHAEGAYSKYEIINDPYEKEENLQQIKIYLYSNQAKTKPITDTNVRVYIDYDFKNVIQTNENKGILVYNLWGDLWTVDLGQLTASIHLNSKDNVKYTLNEQTYTEKIYWENTTLNINSKNIPSKTLLQINITFPLDNTLSENTKNSNQVNESKNNHTIVESDESLKESEKTNQSNQSTKSNESHQSNESNNSVINIFPDIMLPESIKTLPSGNELDENNLINSFLNIWITILILTLLIPIAIYLKYGNFSFKSKRNYNYNNELRIKMLEKYPPAFVNSLFGKGRKLVGKVNDDGFQATILDLINKKYLKATFVKSNKKKPKDISKNKQISETGETRKILLELNWKLLLSDKTDIKKYEKNLLKCLASIEKDGIIDFENAKEMRLSHNSKFKISI